MRAVTQQVPPLVPRDVHVTESSTHHEGRSQSSAQLLSAPVRDDQVAEQHVRYPQVRVERAHGKAVPVGIGDHANRISRAFRGKAQLHEGVEISGGSCDPRIEPVELDELLDRQHL